MIDRSISVPTLFVCMSVIDGCDPYQSSTKSKNLKISRQVAGKKYMYQLERMLRYVISRIDYLPQKNSISFLFYCSCLILIIVLGLHFSGFLIFSNTRGTNLFANILIPTHMANDMATYVDN